MITTTAHLLDWTILDRLNVAADRAPTEIARQLLLSLYWLHVLY